MYQDGDYLRPIGQYKQTICVGGNITQYIPGKQVLTVEKFIYLFKNKEHLALRNNKWPKSSLLPSWTVFDKPNLNTTQPVFGFSCTLGSQGPKSGWVVSG